MPKISGWSPPQGETTTFLIRADLSGVVDTPDGYGIHPTRRAALEALILHLESEKTEVTDKLAAAKRALRRELRRVARD